LLDYIKQPSTESLFLDTGRPLVEGSTPAK
jgi:hypothetical protein